MAREPVNTSERPSMASVQCGGPDCGEYIVVDRAFTGVGYCSDCMHDHLGHSADPARVPPPPHWLSANNPPPPDPIYPPSASTGIPLNPADPDIVAYCMDHRPMLLLHPLSRAADDVALSYGIHDHVHHDPDAWLIGGAGGASDDICRACGGAYWDKEAGREMPLRDGPRHDLCMRGKTQGRGGNCPCRHDRPWMRGIKPGNHPADRPGAVERARAALAEHRPEPAPAPAIPLPNLFTFDPDNPEDTE